MPGSRIGRGQTADRARPASPAHRTSVTPLSFQEESALLCEVFARSPDAMAFIDPEFIVRAANEAFAGHVRLPLSRVIGHRAEAAIPGWMEQLGHICEQVRATGKAFQAEARPLVLREHHERRVVYWNITISSVHRPDNAFIGYLFLGREVTSREMAQEDRAQLLGKVQRQASELETTVATLRESEAQLRRLAESNIIGVVTADPDHIIDANDAFLRMVGYSRQDLQSGSIPWPEMTPAEYRQLDRRGIEDLLSHGAHPPFEKEVIRKDGSRVPILTGAALLERSPLKWVCFVVDLTERKQAETERETLLAEVEHLVTSAQERASELEAVLDSIADGVFVCDTNASMVDVNEAALRITGLSRPDALARHEIELLRLLDLRHPDGRPIGEEEMVMTQALRGEVIRGFEKVATDPRSKRQVHFLISAAPLRDRDGQIFGAVAVLSDITSIRELDRLKDQFITVAAHELKTPVAIMKGYAQGLLRTAEDMPGPRRRMLEAIDRGSDRIDSIVEDLLDISRLRVGHLELTKGRVDLPELVQEVVDRVDMASPQHRVRVARTEPVVVQADRYRLDQVLTNLIDNAMRYSPAGGDIDVEVAVREGEAVVSVRDYGVGIPEDKQKHIFERFYRAHTGTPFDYGGMGVGLYICREIVSRHGGKIWFESEEGKGSTFYFSLPL